MINLETPGLDKIMKSRILPFSIAAKGPRADLSANGQVDFSLDAASVEASIQGHVADLNKFSTGVKDFNLPGELTLHSQVKGSGAKLAMEDFSIVWKGPGIGLPDRGFACPALPCAPVAPSAPLCRIRM